MKKIFLSFLMLSLLGCAFGAGTEDHQRDDIERKEELRNRYSRIIGTYEGNLTVSGRTSQMKLYVYTVDVESGKNPMGEPQLIPMLFAKFRRMDGVDGDKILKATYMPSTGEFSAVTEGNFNLRGSFGGRRLDGEIVKTSGFYGSFALEKSTSPQSGPNDGDEQEYRDHVRRELSKVTGIYRGNAYASSERNTILYPMQVEIRTRESYKGDTWTISLYAIWFRTDAHPSLTRQMMSASYDPTVTPATMNLLAEGQVPGSSLPFFLNIVGSIVGGTITAEIYGSQGLAGITTLTRQ